jgi:hypothetical protein
MGTVHGLMPGFAAMNSKTRGLPAIVGSKWQFCEQKSLCFKTRGFLAGGCTSPSDARFIFSL